MKRLLAIAVVLTLSAIGCKRTEESVARSWETATKTVTSLSATYPGFKDAIAAHRKAAEEMLESAKKIADPEAHLEAMDKAARELRSGLIDKLDRADQKIGALKKELVRLASEAREEAEVRALKEAKELVNSTVTKAEAMLKGGAKNLDEASAIVDRASDELELAGKTLRSLSQKIQSRKRREQADKKAAADKAAADKAAEDAKVAPWTCEFCDHPNAHDADNCSNCGAPREGDSDKAAPAAP